MSNSTHIYQIPYDKLNTLLGPVAGLGSVTEIVIRVEPELVSIRVTDPAHVAIMTADWTVHTGDDYTIGLDYEDTMKALRLFPNYETLRVAVTEGTVEISAGNGSRTVPVIDTGRIEVPRVPDIIAPASFLTTVADLRNALKMVSGVSDHLSVYMCEAYTTIDTDANGRLKASATLNGTGKVETCKEYRATYPMDYFSGMVRSLSEGSVMLQIDNDYPLYMVVDRDDIQIGLMLAPRIETE